MSDPTSPDAADETVPADGTMPADETEARPEVHGWPVIDSHGQQVVLCTRDGYLALMSALKEDGFEMCADLCAVDYLTHGGRRLPDGIPAERFEVAVNLVSLAQHRRIRVRVQIPESDVGLPSLFDLWPGTEAMEREAYDMIGIRFVDHPDLTRILMPEDWEGHPLRKDYAVGRVPVQFKETPSAR
jgi:NADH-quinone oxidoreductase subunit C